MKKLLAIVASALTLGVFANSAADPVITADTSAVDPDTTCSVMADNEKVFDFATNGGVMAIQIDEKYVGRRVCLAVDGEEITDSTTANMGAANPKLAALKLAGENTDTVVWSNLGSAITDSDIAYAGAADVKLCLRATDDAPVGSLVKLTKIVIADRPNRDQTTPCYKLTVGDHVYYTEGRVVGTDEVVINTAAAEEVQTKRYTSIYTFAENYEPVLSVGEVYDLIPCLANHTVQTGNRAGATCGKVGTPTTEGILWWNANVSTGNGWNILGEIHGVVLPRDPTTVYTKKNTLNGGFTLDGEDTDLIAGDVIAIKLGTMSGSQWQMDLSKHAGHDYVFEKNEGSDNRFSVVSDIPANTMITIKEGVQTYFYNSGVTPKDHAVADGVVVTGDGKLTVENIVTVNGSVEISVATLEVTSGSFKLADGASLKVPAELAEGKVTPAGSKKRVAFNETTKTYSLVQQREMTVRVVENTTRYYLNAKDENGTSTEMIAIEGNSVLIDNGTGFTAYYIANEGYELSKTADGAKISSDKKMVWYYFTTVTSDQNYDAQVTATAVAPVVPGIDLIPEDQKTGYPAWLEANVTTETTLEVEDIAAAFLLGATVSEGVTIEDAAQAKVEELVAKIDCSKLAGEDGLNAALETLNAELEEKGLVASLKPVTLTGASESTKLYQLVITLKEQN